MSRSREPGGEVLGKVASPPHKESTSDEFHFWAAPGTVVEKTQLVRVDCPLGDQVVKFYGLVREVYRQGRQGSIAQEADRYDGDVAYEPPFAVPGVTYAVATILRTDPPLLAPPVEGCDVILGGEEEARVAYAADEIEEGKSLALGIIKNGGSRTAGPGAIDLDYLLGQNGGHLNVNGVAGRGTKSSFLLHVIYVLLRESRRQARERPSSRDRLEVVPIILNVKNFDLFFIDQPSRKFDPSKHLADWLALGVDDPSPFRDASFFAPQARATGNPVDSGRADVTPYSWSLSDVIELGLFSYLFGEDDVRDDNFGYLAGHVEDCLTHEDPRKVPASRTLDNQDGAVRTFRELVGWLDAAFEQDQFKKHAPQTRRKFQRRLAKVVRDGDGVLRRDAPSGLPLRVLSAKTRGPMVIDIHALAPTPSLQRFVVAAIFRQLMDDRTGGRATQGLRYLVMLDELNRFAPKNSDDPITRLIETVAAEMRSQGIILLGAQQQASLVSTRVFENSGIKAVGKSGAMEMSHQVWRFLGESARHKAALLAQGEKLLVQDSFREPMLVRIPMPPWALNREEAPHLAGRAAFLGDLDRD